MWRDFFVSEGKKKIKQYRAKIEQWKSKGYDISELEEMIKGLK